VEPSTSAAASAIDTRTPRIAIPRPTRVAAERACLSFNRCLPGSIVDSMNRPSARTRLPPIDALGRHAVFLALGRARDHDLGVAVALSVARRSVVAEVSGRNAPGAFEPRLARLAQHQRKRAERARERQLLGRYGVDFEGDRLD